MATADLLQVILFSHRGVFTPVCTPEFGEVACRASEFANCNVKIIGISAISLEDHYRWIQDINDYGSKVGPIDVQFPIVNTCPFDPFSALVTSLGIRTQIADEDRKISTLHSLRHIATPKVFLLRYVPSAEKVQIQLICYRFAQFL